MAARPCYRVRIGRGARVIEPIIVATSEGEARERAAVLGEDVLRARRLLPWADRDRDWLSANEDDLPLAALEVGTPVLVHRVGLHP